MRRCIHANTDWWRRRVRLEQPSAQVPEVSLTSTWPPRPLPATGCMTPLSRGQRISFGVVGGRYDLTSGAVEIIA